MSSNNQSLSSIDLRDVHSYIDSVARRRLYGVVSLSFQNGACFVVRTEESLKSSDIHNLVATSRGESNGTRNS
jgi:hypothetical protein